jgi:hypothetical protein
MSTEGTSKREQIIEGLRALADFYEQHPDVPLPPFPGWNHCVLGNVGDEAGPAEVRVLAAALGSGVEERRGHTITNAQFGAINFHAYYVSRERAEAYDADQEFLAEHGRGSR